ncbi:MAG: transcription antitermination protein NusB [Halanaerobiales bacterium]|nr:transcription antitermination protein NusB [Halanaerobiales bacterium]
MVRVTRHQQRVWALQILYCLDLTGELNLAQAQKHFRNLRSANDLDEEDYYFEEIVEGVIKDLNRFDRIIDRQAIDWQIERMAYIDRNILRIALYEMENEIPVGVAINEAVELAKEYGDEKSAGFINGILAKVKGE